MTIELSVVRARWPRESVDGPGTGRSEIRGAGSVLRGWRIRDVVPRGERTRQRRGPTPNAYIVGVFDAKKKPVKCGDYAKFRRKRPGITPFYGILRLYCAFAEMSGGGRCRRPGAAGMWNFSGYCQAFPTSRYAYVRLTADIRA